MSSFGWGFRGDYGHEAGAMFPGAFLGLAILLASGREDWQRRITIVAFAAAMGWAFGGSVSYGKVVGYTAHTSVLDVAYGYASLFIIGAMWGSIGAGCLGLALTMKRSWLNSWAGPLMALYLVWVLLDFTGVTAWLEDRFIPHDADGVAALSALLVGLVCLTVKPWRPAGELMTWLSAGWCLGFIILVMLLGLHMTPPRGDNWAGIIGVAIAFAVWLIVYRNRAALYLFLVGLLAGGYGFALGDGLNMMGRAGWGYFGELATQYHLDVWKWMEQSFGFIMGLGVALGILRLLRGRLRPPNEDARAGLIQLVGLLFLLIVMPWLNFFKNVRNLGRSKMIGAPLFGWPEEMWYLLIGLGLAIMLFIACLQYYRKELALAPSRPHGRAQLLLLFLMWTSVLAAFLQAYPHMNTPGTLWVHITFWITAIIVNVLTILQPKPSPVIETLDTHAYSDTFWRPGLMFWVLVILIPFVIAGLTYGTTGMHGHPLHGSHLRFEK
ncbi:MAG TPA: hypothetical protein PLN21_13755 [Gemmatales bacterium]|nr:hypothetical protein [Gemmatales bacterium]